MIEGTTAKVSLAEIARQNGRRGSRRRVQRRNEKETERDGIKPVKTFASSVCNVKAIKTGAIIKENRAMITSVHAFANPDWYRVERKVCVCHVHRDTAFLLLTSCAGTTCHVRREFFVPKL